MYAAAIIFYRVCLNLLLLVSPSRLFDTINNCSAYRDILHSWIQQPGISNNHSILELGCGPGLLSCHLAVQGNRVTGIDRSGSMINRALQNCGSNTGTAGTEVKFIQADATSTRLEPATFNSVIGASILNVVSAPDLIAEEARRLLVPGGQTSFLFPGPEMTPGRVAQYAIRQNYSPFAAAVLVTWAGKSRKLVPETVEQLLAAAGFAGIQNSRIMDGMISCVSGRKESAPEKGALT